MDNSFKKFVSGGIAGGIGVSVVYPIDLIKTRLQNQIGTSNKYKGSIDCFLQTVKREGVRGLYKGLRPQLIGVAPEKALKLTVNDTLKFGLGEYSLSEYNLGQTKINIICGAIAGLSQVIVTNPLEITKIQLQLYGEKYPNSPTSLVYLVKKLKLKGLYKGSGACMMRDIPFSGIYFPLYSYLKNKFSNNNKITNTNQMIVGTLAGACAAGATTPADVIKTRLQVNITKSSKRSGIVKCYKNIVKYEGYSSLFKGLVPRVSRSAPQFGITLYIYELFKENFD